MYYSKLIILINQQNTLHIKSIYIIWWCISQFYIKWFLKTTTHRPFFGLIFLILRAKFKIKAIFWIWLEAVMFKSIFLFEKYYYFFRLKSRVIESNSKFCAFFLAFYLQSILINLIVFKTIINKNLQTKILANKLQFKNKQKCKIILFCISMNINHYFHPALESDILTLSL